MSSVDLTLQLGSEVRRPRVHCGFEHPEVGRKLVVDEDCGCPEFSIGAAFLATIIEPADQEGGQETAHDGQGSAEQRASEITHSPFIVVSARTSASPLLVRE